MGVFDFIFGKRISIEDEVFGKMTYEKFKDPSKNYFIAYVNTFPNSNEVSLYIDADQHGPTKTQKDFYKKFIIKYKKFVPIFKDALVIELANFPKFNSVNDFENEFILESLNIPRNVDETNMCNASYYSKLHPEFSFNFNFNDNEVISISIDS